MEISEQNQTKEEFHYFDEDESDADEYDSDDSQDDPTFEIVEEIRSSFSRLSTKKDSKSRTTKEPEEDNEEVPDVLETVVPELDDEDQKSFKVVQNIIEAGHLEKLKVDQCKVYLRKYGLRLTGKKDTLLERIKEHLDIISGGGEKKYPISSFLLNCKGDACAGDVVMFEQKVYEMFNIASRCASGPPCGTRIVAGRIVKESYGAAKQQHTFTIEVLWSKGEKPLPPLYPLLIKGRNLYRLKTMRQKWENEGERQKILSEKHTRGSLARSNREARVQEKKMRKMLKAFRVSQTEDQNGKRKETKAVSFQSLSVDSERLRSQSQTQEQVVQQKEYGYSKTSKENNSVSVEQLHRQLVGFFPNANLPPERINQWQHSKSTLQSQNHEQSAKPVTPSRCHAQGENFNRFRSPYRRPLTIRNHLQNHNIYMNYNPLKTSSTQWQGHKQQICRFYAHGRCYYGNHCKFLHEARKN